MATPDEIIDNYSAQLQDGDFVTEFREGSIQVKKMTPDQAKALFEIGKASEAAAAAKSRGPYVRIVD